MTIASKRRSILVLEDEQYRVDALRHRIEDVRDVIHIRYVDAFKKWHGRLRNDGLCAVILDHDLGSLSETGMDAVDYLIREGCGVPIVVWSFNSVARPQMCRKLRDARLQVYSFPFGREVLNTLTRLFKGPKEWKGEK